MRLLDAQNLVLVEFPPNKIPPYVIFSHTWTDSEVSYGEFADPAVRSKLGFQKIIKFCEKVVEAGFRYAWVDTCCIDKSSSADLTEAINSMYMWYKEAAICHAYLVDVESHSFLKENDLAFRNSRWFLRGWTLQELLAPSDVLFFSSDWVQLGSRNGLGGTISQVTGIREGILTGSIPVRSASVAQRMSWASHRETTRPEDMAYCLLGLFGVNMPMLYGEGDQAFRRLQEEIMKKPDDQSLFAWAHTQGDPNPTGLLAPHPRNFARSGQYEDLSQHPELRGQGISTTARGIELDVFLSSVDDTGSCFATLKCTESRLANRFAHITLQQCKPPEEEYVRVSELPRGLLQGPIRGRQTRILVRHELAHTPSDLQDRYCRLKVVSQNLDDRALVYLPVSPLVKDERLEVCGINDIPHYRIENLEHQFRLPILPSTEVLKVKIVTPRADIALSIGTNDCGVLSLSADWTGRFTECRPELYVSGYGSKSLTHYSSQITLELAKRGWVENSGEDLELTLWFSRV